MARSSSHCIIFWVIAHYVSTSVTLWTTQFIVQCDMCVSGQFPGWKKPGCIISWSKPDITRGLWKAACVNCLCAVSQGFLCSVASAQFTALETCCLFSAESRSPCSGNNATSVCQDEWVPSEGKWWRERIKCTFMEGSLETFPVSGPLSASAPVMLCCYNWKRLQHPHRHMGLPLMPFLNTVIVCSPYPQEVVGILINHVACALNIKPSSCRPMPDLRLNTLQLKLILAFF